MTEWILVLIITNYGNISVESVGGFKTMKDCTRAGQAIIQLLPQEERLSFSNADQYLCLRRAK